MQHGFKFTIRGDVFVPRKSSSGRDIIAAAEEADEIRAKIQEMLFDLPVDFNCTLPRAASRQAPDPVTEAEKTDPPADGG